MRTVIALDEPHGARLADELSRLGWDAEARPPAAPGLMAARGRMRELADRSPELLVIASRHDTLTRDVVMACDREGIRIIPVGEGEASVRLAQAFGLGVLMSPRVSGRELMQAVRAPIPAAPMPPGGRRVIVVWGPAGSPGRSTIAIELAVHLARDRSAALVDADSHAPSVAITLGLPDEGPGFAAACRQVTRGALDVAELERIALRVGRGPRVLTGINRPSRWPELREDRVRRALAVCREWVDDTVVDVAAPLDRDEEIVSDLAGDRRNAATIAALQEADLVVAVAGADPVGIGRFVRGYAQLRETVGSTPIAVIANRLRPGALGIDARGQVRRSLDRFAGIRDVWFVPQDPRSADAALLAARPIAEVARRSPIVSAVRRFAAEALTVDSRNAA
ncbi:AAA family ATPase [Microbacterium sp. bgisy207]|uniref:AAA family ATPase n=1 Tax=Microbacterium sp. bgisy207 TaxID=3413800 RepID=UPI003EBC4F04